MSIRRINFCQSLKKRVTLPMCRIRDSSSLFRIQNFSNSAAKHTTDFLNHESTAIDNLQPDGSLSCIDSEHESLMIRPPDIFSEMSVAIRKRDSQHLHSTLAGLDRIGGLDGITLESCIKQCLSANDVDNATILLALALPRKLDITAETCLSLLTANIVNFRWHLAAETLSCMIPNGFSIPPNSVYRIFEGLMKDPKGVAALMRVATLINVHKRGDLATAFNLNKVTSFSLKMGPNNPHRNELSRDALIAAIDSSIKALKEGFYSPQLGKLIFSLTAAAKQNDLAAYYMKELTNVIKKENLSIMDTFGRKVCLRSLLKSFLSGIDVVNKTSLVNKNQNIKRIETPLSSILMGVVLENFDDMISDDPSEMIELLKMYWILSYQIRMSCYYDQFKQEPGLQPGDPDIIELYDQKKMQNTDLIYQYTKELTEGTPEISNRRMFFNENVGSQLIKIGERDSIRGDYALRSAASQLKEFADSLTDYEMDFSPPPGYCRRQFRIMCDEMGLSHRLMTYETDPYLEIQGQIKVWKYLGYAYDADLDTVMKRDATNGNLRNFDGEMPDWKTVSSSLAKLPQRTLGCVVLNVTQQVTAEYPSSCWGLQMLDLLSENNLYHSPGILRNITVMCRNRQDIYGLLEVLYAAQEEDELQYEEDLEHFDENEPSIPIFADKRGRTEGRAEYIDTDDTFRNPYDHFYHREEQSEYDNNNNNNNRDGNKYGNDSMSSSCRRRSSELMSEYRPTNKRLLSAKINNLELGEEIENISLSKRRKPSNEDPFMRSIRPNDWNYVTQAGWSCRTSKMPKTSYVAAFAEMMRAAYLCGTHLEPASVRNLLQFMVLIEPWSEPTMKLMRRVFKDKTHPKTKIECIAASHVIMMRDEEIKKLCKFSLPKYSRDDYLIYYPKAPKEMLDEVVMSAHIFGEDFVKNIGCIWSRLDVTGGRYEFSALLLLHMKNNTRRHKIIRNGDERARLTFNALGLYCAYLISSIDQDHATAYEILFKVETVNRAKTLYSVSHVPLNFNPAMESAEFGRLRRFQPACNPKKADPRKMPKAQSIMEGRRR